MATAYLTLDHLADLTPAQRADARQLTFTVAAPNTVGDDFQAVRSSSDTASTKRPFFTFEGVQGAKYFFQSISFVDPASLRIYDRDGRPIVANDEGDDPPQTVANNLVINQDVIFGWRAPYSGTYYVDASWFAFTGLYDHVGLVMFEDRDAGAPNRAPTLATPLPDLSWGEGSGQTATLSYTAFTDPDFNPLAISASLADGGALPARLTFDPLTRKLSGTPPIDSPDLYVRVAATDPVRLSASDEFRIVTTEPTSGLTLTGTAAADTLRGTRFADTLNGAAGNDSITAVVATTRSKAGPASTRWFTPGRARTIKSQAPATP